MPLHGRCSRDVQKRIVKFTKFGQRLLNFHLLAMKKKANMLFLYHQTNATNWYNQLRSLVSANQLFNFSQSINHFYFSFNNSMLDLFELLTQKLHILCISPWNYDKYIWMLFLLCQRHNMSDMIFGLPIGLSLFFGCPNFDIFMVICIIN